MSCVRYLNRASSDGNKDKDQGRAGSGNKDSSGKSSAGGSSSSANDLPPLNVDSAPQVGSLLWSIVTIAFKRVCAYIG